MTLDNTMSPFQNKLKRLMDEYAHFTYKITKKFPKEEIYSSVSQIRRATLSVILNYVEGYGRRRPKVQLNFYEISYGSLNESRYLYYFALVEGWLDKKDYDYAIKTADEIGKMLWSEITSTENKL